MPLPEKAPTGEPLDPASACGALDELFLLARHYKKSAAFQDLLRFVASFRRYSAFNAMLVHVQMPGARYVLPAKRWLKEYERRPKEGAQPLVMLQPKGPVQFGFDVSQTEGRAVPAEVSNPFDAKGQIERSEFDQSLANANRSGVEVRWVPLGSTLGGYVRDAGSPHHVIGLGLVKGARGLLDIDGQEVPKFADITLNSNLSLETNYATLTHELGHLYCGHVGTPDPRHWPDRRKLDRQRMEFEAESVSYLVCQRAGLETPAVAYLHGYLSANGEVPEISLDLVFKAAQRIERMRAKVLPSRPPKEKGT